LDEGLDLRVNISVQFFGLARALAGSGEVDLHLHPGATYTAVVEQLGAMFPGLIGLIIDTDGRTLLSANMFSLDGEEMIQPDQMEGCPKDGDRLMLMSIIVGGV
jgi:molybdopterin converting factor small subunit